MLVFSIFRSSGRIAACPFVCGFSRFCSFVLAFGYSLVCAFVYGFVCVACPLIVFLFVRLFVSFCECLECAIYLDVHVMCETFNGSGYIFGRYSI